MVKLLTYFCILFSFIAIGCNPGIVDAPVGTDANIYEYFWPSTVGQLVYERDSAGSVGARYTVVFSQDSNRTIVTSRENGNNAELFTLLSTTEGLFLEDIKAGNILFPIPAQYNLISNSKEDTIEVITPKKFEHVLVLNSGSMVAVDNENRLYYYSDAIDSWDTISWSRGKVTSLAAKQDTIIVGTANGELVWFFNEFRQSKAVERTVKKPITAIATSPKLDEIFIAQRDVDVFRVFFDRYDTAVDMNRPLKKVTSLGLLSTSRLIAGTEDSGIYTAEIEQWDGWSGPSLLGKCLQLFTFNTSAYALCEVGGSPKLLVSSNNGVTWMTNSSLPTGAYLLAGSVESKIMLVATVDGQVIPYSIVNGSAQAGNKIKLSSGKIYSISAAGKVLAAATDSGIFVSSNGVDWSKVTDPLLQDREHIRVPARGAVRLLTADTDALDSGKTWVAATGVITGTSVPFHVQGAVKSKLSSLILPHQAGEYKDVIPVIYYLDGMVDALKVVIYYARNIGPVLIEQYLGANAPVRVYLISD